MPEIAPILLAMTSRIDELRGGKKICEVSIPTLIATLAPSVSTMPVVNRIAPTPVAIAPRPKNPSGMNMAIFVNQSV
jgi:hypothetical protein